MKDLIERLKLAVKPDPSLDAAIVAELHQAIVRPYPPTDDFGPKARWQFWSRDGAHFLANESKWPVLPYTKSIEAALTLMQEGYRPCIELAADGFWVVGVRPAVPRRGRDMELSHRCAHVSAAIAICCVALEARAANGGA